MKKQIGMIRKYQYHTLPINSQHREEKPQNTECNKTSGKIEATSSLSLFSTKMIAKRE